MKQPIFAIALLGATVALAGCGGDPQPVVEEEAGIPGLEITNARVVLGPVEGNPAAVYFDLAYNGDRALTLRRADVDGAKSAMLHQYSEWDGEMQMMEAAPIALTGGTEISFEPGGPHVMAMNPSPELQPGGTTEVTLTVSGGDTITFPAEIRAAGENR